MNEGRCKLCRPRGWISKSANNSVVYILLLFAKPVTHHDIFHPQRMLRGAPTQFYSGWYTSRIDWNVLKCNKAHRLYHTVNKFRKYANQ